MRAFTHRHTYVAKIGRFLRPIEPIAGLDGYDWEKLLAKNFDHLLRFLYGLPVEVQVGLAVNVLKRYLPTFEFHRPDDLRARKVVEAAELWLKDRCEGNAKLQECRLGAYWELELYWHFLNAVSLLKYMLLNWAQDMFRSAAATADIVSNCIWQRMNDIWRADNPRDYEAGQMVQDIEWKLMVRENELSEEEKQGLEAEIERLVAQRESSQVGNVVVRAVAYREWLFLQQWMQKIADMYPTGMQLSRREIWMWWGYSWDASYERKRLG
ncbi:MAG: hypothetical protein K6U75_17085 [Firmicutes bacterium]|nr:hypothetical protein [Bacillota bacterium]